MARIAAKNPAKAAAAIPLRDGEEWVEILQTMRITEENAMRAELSERVLELTRSSTAFSASLPAGLREPLAEFVRSMNCYYSNLIEGHDTHPVDIERALNNDLSSNPERRDLQLEAKAHIAVQRWIDESGPQTRECSLAWILEVHRRFTVLLPEDLKWASNSETGERVPVVAGALRVRDAKVGRHIAVSPGALQRFMGRFEREYADLKAFEALLSAAAAHHRLLFIHPFADGNGRVTRLMSYATFRRALDTGGLWSVARGLARRQSDYKAHLAACDEGRSGDRDGRGTLSRSGTIFIHSVLSRCLHRPNGFHAAT